MRCSLLLIIALTLGACAVTPSEQQTHLLAQITQARELYQQENYPAALAAIRQAHTYAEAQDEQQLVQAIEYSYAGQIQAQNGDFKAARDALQRSLALQQALNDREAQAKTLTSLANLQTYFGAYPQARTLLAEAAELARQSRSAAEQSRLLVSGAVISVRLRDYQSALNEAEQALALAPTDNLRAEALNIHGMIYREQGDWAQAIDYYQQALQLNTASGHSEQASTNRMNLAELFIQRDDYAAADTLLRQELALNQTRGNRLWAAVALSYLTELAIAQADYAQAAVYAEQELAEFETLQMPDRIARARLKLGIIDSAQNRFQNAAAHYRLALPIYRELGDGKWLSETLYRQGLALQAAGQITAAEASFREGIDVFEQVRDTVPPDRLLRQRFNQLYYPIYEPLIELLLRTGRVREALYYVNRSQTKQLRDLFDRNGFSDADPQLRELLNQYRALSAQERTLSERLSSASRAGTDPQRIARLQDNLERTRTAFSEILEQIAAIDSDAYRLLTVTPEDLLRVTEELGLPDSVMLLAYFTARDQLYIFYILQGEIGVKTSAISRAELNALIASVRELIFRSQAVDPQGWAANDTIAYQYYLKPLLTQLDELYRVLLEPIAPQLAQAEHIALLPFGALHYLPFHALRPHDGPFLLERKKVSYLIVPAVRDWLERDKSTVDLSAISAFGDPDIGDLAPRLPNAEREVRNLQSTFPDSTIYLGAQASKTNFSQDWGQNAVLHIAAHGELSPEFGASLLLAPARDGRLTLAEITALARKDNYHPAIILSACESALQASDEGPAGSEVDSVAYAFSRSGAKAVLSTLWVVDDAITADLMAGFYQTLRDNKSWSYDALRTAQLSLIASGGVSSQPFYWAPFIYYGDW